MRIFFRESSDVIDLKDITSDCFDISSLMSFNGKVYVWGPADKTKLIASCLKKKLTDSLKKRSTLA